MIISLIDGLQHFQYKKKAAKTILIQVLKTVFFLNLSPKYKVECQNKGSQNKHHLPSQLSSSSYLGKMDRPTRDQVENLPFLNSPKVQKR